MWALVCLVATVYAVLHAWIRSRLPWMDFLLLRAAFVYSRLWHRWSCKRRAALPVHGPAIVISNHTSSADPPILLAGCDRLLSFLVSREHFNLHPVTHAVLRHMACIGVTRTGQDPRGLLAALKRLADGGIVCVFPEGGLSGVALNRLRPGKPGAALLALRSKAPVYPVYISGGPRTDQLLRSWVLPSRKAVRVTYGKPIDLSAYYDRPRTRRLIEELTQLMMKKIEELNPRGDAMNQTDLTRKHCQSCEGGVPALTRGQIDELLPAVRGWMLTADAKALRRQWRVKDFATALDFFQRIGEIAETEDHHPDLHLTGYRNVSIELSTHAIGGLSENDFILAAKINELPVELKK